MTGEHPPKIDDTAAEGLAVAPDGSNEQAPACHPADAGQDTSIIERMRRNPESKEARLDRALDESMDASDPPSSTQPVHSQDPAPSSGYDETAERGR